MISLSSPVMQWSRRADQQVCNQRQDTLVNRKRTPVNHESVLESSEGKRGLLRMLSLGVPGKPRTVVETT